MTTAEAQAQLTPTSYSGQSGWWIFPQRSGDPMAWYSYTDKNSQIWVSPNPDFSTPKYAAKINVDGYLIIYDQYLNRVSGTN